MPGKMETIARSIYDFCKQHDVWGDNTIYFDGIAWSNQPDWNGVSGKKIDDELYLYENKNPLDYFEYANPETLSMSFEGDFYYVMNGYYPHDFKLEEEFLALLESFGYFYELGNAWNLAIYKL